MVAFYGGYDDNAELQGLLQGLATAPNVPDDIFSHLKIKKVHRYHVPVYVWNLVATGTVESGDKLYDFNKQMTVIFPGYREGDVPKELQVPMFVTDEDCAYDVHPVSYLTDESHVWTSMAFDFEEESVVEQKYGKAVGGEMARILKAWLKKEQHLSDDMNFRQYNIEFDADESEAPSKFPAYHPVSVIQYEYKDQRFEIVYDCNGLRAEAGTMPVEAEAKGVEDFYNKRKTASLVGMGAVVLFHQLVWGHWLLTGILLLGLLGLWYKFRSELQGIQAAASDVRLKQLEALTDEECKALLELED